jgi:hypothetical protein
VRDADAVRVSAEIANQLLGSTEGATSCMSMFSRSSAATILPRTSMLPCRRAGCGKSACPDPWGPREGNDPGLPDRLMRASIR